MIYFLPKQNKFCVFLHELLLQKRLNKFFLFAFKVVFLFVCKGANKQLIALLTNSLAITYLSLALCTEVNCFLLIFLFYPLL